MAHSRAGFDLVYVRVSATYNPSTNASFAHSSRGAPLELVAVNTGTSAVSQQFIIAGVDCAGYLPAFSHSSTEDLATLGTIGTSGGSVHSVVTGQSITSFVLPMRTAGRSRSASCGC
jgi:glucuronoarabinoxylan endo-1,4-beta-xylanase